MAAFGPLLPLPSHAAVLSQNGEASQESPPCRSPMNLYVRNSTSKPAACSCSRLHQSRRRDKVASVAVEAGLVVL